MRRFGYLFIMLSIFFLMGCSAKNASPEGSAPPSSFEYIENKGSDTIVNLALAWAERYQNENTAVSISVTGGGSGTGITALINGTVDIANASRQIKSEELEAAKSAGYNPQEFVIARDAIAIVVHPSNPIDHLTLEQLAMIYKGEIINWSELGGEDREIVRLSRETNSGTHVFFLQAVVRLGSDEDKSIFSADTLLLPSSEGIIAEVRDNSNAIGYDSLGYNTDEVKLVAVSSVETPGNFILPSLETVNNDTYLISRNLYMYTLDVPAGAVKEYMDWIFSVDAQEIVSELGLIPIINK